MGLLDRANAVRDEPASPAPALESSDGLAAAAVGLRARAEQFRQHARPGGNGGAAGGVRIRGLLARAQAVHNEAVEEAPGASAAVVDEPVAEEVEPVFAGSGSDVFDDDFLESLMPAEPLAGPAQDDVLREALATDEHRAPFAPQPHGPPIPEKAPPKPEAGGLLERAARAREEIPPPVQEVRREVPRAPARPAPRRAPATPPPARPAPTPTPVADIPPLAPREIDAGTREEQGAAVPSDAETKALRRQEETVDRADEVSEVAPLDDSDFESALSAPPDLEEEAGTAPEEAPSGLLARAQKAQAAGDEAEEPAALAEESYAAPLDDSDFESVLSAPPDLEEEAGAAQEEAPSGLLARAQKAQAVGDEAEEPAALAEESYATPLDDSDFESVLSAPPDLEEEPGTAPEEAPSGLLARAQKAQAGDDSTTDDEEWSTPDVETLDFDDFARKVLSDEEQGAPSADDDDSAAWADVPELAFEASSPESDPAFQAPAEEDQSGDVFDEWERDAERIAETEARQLEESGTPAPAPRDEFLFDTDSDFTTIPAEVQIASQKKIDHYLSLFDITKEISNVSEFDELWDSLLYAIMAQMGAETICLFSTEQKKVAGAIFHPVAHSGFELPEGWALKPGDEIYEHMLRETGVTYAEEFRRMTTPLSAQEQEILEVSKAHLVFPLKNMNRMYGIAILGPALSETDYSMDDLEFLQLLGEMAAVGVDRVVSRAEFERDTSDLKRRTRVHAGLFSLMRRTSRLKNLDELYDVLAQHLRDDFGVESYSLVLLSPRDQRYRIFAGNQISPDSIERFNLAVNSNLIATVSNLIRVYDLADFRENEEIARAYTNDDLALMQHYWIVPLINMNWLVGFITIHRTTQPWTEFQRELAVSMAEMISAVFANCIILGERETLFRDPFSPLEERLAKEIKDAGEFNAPVALVDLRVRNIRRLVDVNAPESIADFLASLNRSIASFLFEADFMARVGQGRFALILPGRGRDEAEIFVKKLRAEFRRLRLLPGSPVDVQYSHNIMVAPEESDDAGRMLSLLD